MFLFGDDNHDSKRTLGIRDKQILYRNAKGTCQNPGCKRKIEFDEMQFGHKTAWSKGGRTTLTNSVCLCWRCNKLQGTDNWTIFLKKQGFEDPEAKAKTEAKKSAQSLKETLKTFTLPELKALATKHRITVKGDSEENWLGDVKTFTPTKANYVDRLALTLKEKDLSANVPKTPATKTTRKVTGKIKPETSAKKVTKTKQATRKKTK